MRGTRLVSGRCVGQAPVGTVDAIPDTSAGAEPDPTPAGPTRSRTRRALVGPAVGLGALGLVLYALVGGPADPSAFPPYEGPTRARVEPADFLGAQACAECHASEYAGWAGSTHGRRTSW